MYGMKRGYYSETEGFNSRLDEIQAAILNVKLNYLDQWISQRQKIAQYYLKNITNPKIILPSLSKTENHAFHLFVIRTSKREEFIAKLAQNNIGSGIHYPFPIHLQRAYKFLKYKKNSLPKTERFSREIVSLPIFPELTEKEMQEIVKVINGF
jgi:dTDP-4-amino-4,6-dideoxygalactose transaminase